jgi:hypothetical protein
MRGIFPETRKRWTDGLDFGVEDTRDYYEKMYWCFGSDDNAGDSGGLSDEDIDNDLQQSAAAAAYGLSSDEFDYAPGFDPDNLSDDQQAAVDATRSISEAAAFGQSGVDAAQAAAAASPSISQAVANLTGMNVGGYAPGQTQAGARQQAIERAYAVDSKGNPVRSTRDGKPSGYVGRSFDPVTGRAPTEAEKTAIQGAADIALGESVTGGFAPDDIFSPDDPSNLAGLNQIGISPTGLPVGQTRAETATAASVLAGAARPEARVTAVGRGPLDPSLSSINSNVLSRGERGRRSAGVNISDAKAVSELQNRALSGDLNAARALNDAANKGTISAPNAGVSSTGVVGAPPSLGSAAASATSPGMTTAQMEEALDAQFSAQAPSNLGVTASPSVSADSALGLSPGAMGGRAVNPNAPGQLSATDLSALGALAAAGFDDDFSEIGNRATGLGYDPVTGFPTDMETFTNSSGVTTTTNVAGLTREQAEQMPGYMNTRDPVTGEVREGIVPGLVDTVFGNPAENTYGYEIDPTGRVTGLVGPPSFEGPTLSIARSIFGGTPETTEDLLSSGVYTGFGAGSQLGTSEDAAGGVEPQVDKTSEEPVTDPCPPGYALIDGVCTPVSAEEEAAFKFNTNTGTQLFQPFTQATQIGGINPFILQPYRPGQNPFARTGSVPTNTGIQTLSPTGAALGRSI